MNTKLTLDVLDRDMRLLHRREQESRSYVLELMKLLYVQHAQASYEGIGTSSYNLRLVSKPGSAPDVYAPGDHYGVVVGEGTTAATPTDLALDIPIFNGKDFKGTPAKFTNRGFETGDLTGWTVSGASVQSGAFLGSTGRYYCRMSGAATRYISQDIDLTNVAGVRVSFHIYSDSSHETRFRIYVDTDVVFEAKKKDGSMYYTGVAALNYAGVHTVKLEYNSIRTASYGHFDNIETWGKELEYAGSELIQPTFSDPNGELGLRRFFTNSSGNNITVNEVGLVAVPGRLIARDIVSPGITLADTNLLKATYTMKTTV